MAGRRRRVSNSTVATFDDSHVPYVPELSVLKGLAADNEDSDDWPIFRLSEAVILYSDGRRLANPLFVEGEGPFIIQGTLEVDEDQHEYLLKPQAFKSAHIEIRASWLYSIGLTPPGYDSIDLWVSGKAGWFQITPAVRYEAMYREIREAITLYFVIFDICKAEANYFDKYATASKIKKKKMKPPKSLSLDSLFLKYAVAIGDGIYHREAEARCHKWARFLINHFPKEGGFDWSETLFHQWIIEKHPDVQKKRLKQAGSAAAVVPSPKEAPKPRTLAPTPSRLERSQTRGSATTRDSHDTEDSEMQGATGGSPSAATPRTAARRRAAKPESYADSQSPRARLSDSNSPPAHMHSQSAEDFEPVINILLTLLEEISNESMDLKRVRWKTVNSKIYQKCKFKDYRTPTEILTYYSRQLFPRIPSKWRQTPFYDELRDATLQPDKPFQTTSLEIIPSQLVRRIPNHKPAQLITTPVPSKIDIKAKARRSLESSEDESDDVSRRGPRIPSRHAGKGAGLRLKTASKKRTASEMDVDSRTHRDKSAKRSHPLTDDDDDEAAEETSDVATPNYDEDEDPDSLAMPPPKDAVRIVVHAEKIPSMSPSGPNGTWVCDQEECGFVVRSAEEDAGKALIQQHFRDHESQVEMMDLAVSEGRRGHMPIDHLLAKIQAMRKSAGDPERGTLNGDPLVAPIKRRLLI